MNVGYDAYPSKTLPSIRELPGGTLFFYMDEKEWCPAIRLGGVEILKDLHGDEPKAIDPYNGNPLYFDSSLQVVPAYNACICLEKPL